MARCVFLDLNTRGLNVKVGIIICCNESNVGIIRSKTFAGCFQTALVVVLQTHLLLEFIKYFTFLVCFQFAKTNYFVASTSNVAILKVTLVT